MLATICEKRLGTSMRVSAPGKIILVGEHSVVYGKQAIAFSLGLRTELLFRPSKDAVTLHLPEIQVEESWSIVTLKRLWEKLKRNEPSNSSVDFKTMTDQEGQILKDFLGVEGKEIEKRDLGLLAFFHLYVSILPYPVPFCISVKSQMPVGSGLGSSAAYAVCLASILQWLAGSLSPVDLKRDSECNDALKSVCDWSFCCEKILHGTPSGIDNTICTYGKAVSFKAGKIELLKPPPLRIMLVNTGVSRSTRTLVFKVRERYNKLNEVVEPILKSMDNIANSALITLKEMSANSLADESLNRKLGHLQQLIDMNHNLLAALDVSHPTLERLVYIAKSHGLHAKLTGAGGGGFGFVLLSPDTPQIVIDSCLKDFKLEGFHTWLTALGNQGMTMAPF